MRETEHKRDFKTLEEKKLTKAREKDSLMELYPLAITDHIVKENHTIDCEGMNSPLETLIGLPEG